ncbi:MAG: sensor domain-containing diguanylate cyclase [Gammaproteobacteria bacterium]|nr:sensor domain-containing diguanylate cyclase [Gammaproteobacteria bacterium]
MPEESASSLKERLDAYMERARANEHKLRQFQDMELRLMSAESLPDLCRVLVEDYKEAFGLDIVRLILIDSGNQLGTIFKSIFRADAHDHERNARLLSHIHLISDYQGLQDLEAVSLDPVLMAFNEAQHRRFFPADLGNPGSVAILPMRRHGLLLGMLCLGSRDKERYSPEMATDFLQRLALMAGVSLENAVNIEYLRQLSLKDTLTSASNRRYFFQRMQEEISRAQRQSHSVGCLYMDLDHFKRINDHYGHAAGDMVLIHISNIIQRTVRNSDVLSRLGGEEFAVILPDISKFRMGEIAERIRITIERQPCELTTETLIDVSVSIGLAFFDLGEVVGEPIELGEALVNQADQALLYAKENGRNRVCAYEDIAALTPGHRI